MNVLHANAEASGEFRVKLAELISSNLDQLEAELAAAWGSQDTRFLRLFCIGLGKWLLGILTHAAPPRELTLLSGCYYQSGPTGPDMLSLAFLCGAPVHSIKDPSAILPVASAAPVSSEIDCALQIAAGAAAMFDLDERLSSDKELRERLIGQAGRLLATARYTKDDYEAWARARFG